MRPPVWTAEEEEYLREHYREMTDEQLGEALGRGAPAVKNRRALLCLFQPKGRYSRSWLK